MGDVTITNRSFPLTSLSFFSFFDTNAALDKEKARRTKETYAGINSTATAATGGTRRGEKPTKRTATAKDRHYPQLLAHKQGKIMKFADCETKKREENAGKTYTEMQSLDMFESYAPEEGEKRFVFDEYTIRLEGIAEDFKVYFGEFGPDKNYEWLVGEQVYGASYIKDPNAYNRMIFAIKTKDITL
jgi:hypothetical protein